MLRYLSILSFAALVIALPFIFRQDQAINDWRPGDPRLVIISPHNEAIRYEFARAFSDWHQEHHGRPVKIDWRAIGGTTEIMRYLQAEYTAAFRGWWVNRGGPWPLDGAAIILDRRFNPDAKPDEASAAWDTRRELYLAFRTNDHPERFTAKIDLFFGGGAYDHGKAHALGLTVKPWDEPPEDLFEREDGAALIPRALGGETWRTDTFFGNALSTFGIVYNVDRINDLDIGLNPAAWKDLAHPGFFGQLGVADPTKSGSIAKAFEMIVHEQCHQAVRAAGYSPEEIDRIEADISGGGEPPADYQQAIETGWLNGLRLIQRIGANARYFTDSAGKVPVDVGMGNAAAGIAIDFYGRYQAETTQALGGPPRMVYVTPRGGSSVSADPISLLRGAEHRDLAVRFIEFVLSPEGQKLWNYAPEVPGPPYKYGLRRLPIRRDFYPSDHPAMQKAYEKHQRYTIDPLGDPGVNPYALADAFTYHGRWTGRHFGFHRQFVRAMCMDAGEELRAAWKAILENGGPEAQPHAMRQLQEFPSHPEPVTWRSALVYGKKYDPLDVMREWTVFFRDSYRKARQYAEQGGEPP